VDWQTGDVYLLIRGRTPGRRRHTPELIRLEDNGTSWSKPCQIDVIRDDIRLLTPGPAHGIQLRRGEHEGRLVVPVYYSMENGRQSCGVVYSDDHAKSWTLSGDTSDKTYEPQVVELEDGRVLLTCRDHTTGPEGRRRGVAISDDGGATFQIYRKDDGLPSAGCQATAVRYRVPGEPGEWGPILFGGPAEGRREMTLMLSRDEGDTWPVSRLLYPGHSAYSAMCVLPDGRIALLYERDHYRRLSFATFSLDWLTDDG
jgi:sialidase-1